MCRLPRIRSPPMCLCLCPTISFLQTVRQPQTMFRLQRAIIHMPRAIIHLLRATIRTTISPPLTTSLLTLQTMCRPPAMFRLPQAIIPWPRATISPPLTACPQAHLSLVCSWFLTSGCHSRTQQLSMRVRVVQAGRWCRSEWWMGRWLALQRKGTVCVCASSFHQ
jgi:hypothetical protein